MNRSLPLAALLLCGALSLHAGQKGPTTDQMLAQDVAEFGSKWIYDDLAKGFETAKATGKPLLVSIRCVP